jgi:hypothetical protein
MAADGAGRTGRLACGATGRAAVPNYFSALTAEVDPVGIVKTAFGTIHFNLSAGRAPSSTWKTIKRKMANVMGIKATIFAIYLLTISKISTVKTNAHWQTGWKKGHNKKGTGSLN